MSWRASGAGPQSGPIGSTLPRPPADMSVWAHAGGTVLASFLASLVEFVAALTIVLAVGTVRGWGLALVGTGAGTMLLLVLIALLGPSIAAVPIAWLQLLVGNLLLLFGLRWLKKAILRSARILPLHDGEAAYAEETR